MNEACCQAAHDFIQHGWSPIPIAAKSKKPLISWGEFRYRRADHDEITRWWRQFPSARVGIVTGPISNLLVVDADSEAAFDEVMLLCGYPGYPEGTWKLSDMMPRGLGAHFARTKRGAHLYFKCPADPPKSRIHCGKSKAIDIKADPGYVVAPPSNGYVFQMFLSGDGIRYPPQALLDLAKPTTPHHHTNRVFDNPPIMSLETIFSRLKPDTRALIFEGPSVSTFPSNSETRMSVIRGLLMCGAVPSQILEVFEDYEIHETVEKHNDRWREALERDIAKAQQTGNPTSRQFLLAKIVSVLRLPRIAGNPLEVALEFVGGDSIVDIVWANRKGASLIEATSSDLRQMKGAMVVVEWLNGEDRSTPIAWFHKAIKQ